MNTSLQSHVHQYGRYFCDSVICAFSKRLGVSVKVFHILIFLLFFRIPIKLRIAVLHNTKEICYWVAEDSMRGAEIAFQVLNGFYLLQYIEATCLKERKRVLTFSVE
jgi:hypothetical protein